MSSQERRTLSQQKVQNFLYDVAFFLELAAAFLVIILIICQVVGLGIEMFSDAAGLFDSDNFTHFLELALNIVVGIEFLKMLCRHNMDAVIEVLLFTLARHLIVNQHSMVEGLLCIVSIAILFVVRKFLFVSQIDKVHPVPEKEHKEHKD
ncbi:MAG: transporter [Candidatus Enterenecus sp.]